MQNKNDIKTIQEALDLVGKNGGIGLVPTDNGFRIAIGINPDNPSDVFNQLNDFEQSLLRLAATENGIAGHNMKKIKQYSDMVDNIRVIAINQCKGQGIDCSNIESIPIEIRNKHCNQ